MTKLRNVVIPNHAADRHALIDAVPLDILPDCVVRGYLHYTVDEHPDACVLAMEVDGEWYVIGEIGQPDPQGIPLQAYHAMCHLWLAASLYDDAVRDKHTAYL